MMKRSSWERNFSFDKWEASSYVMIMMMSMSTIYIEIKWVMINDMIKMMVRTVSRRLIRYWLLESFAFDNQTLILWFFFSNQILSLLKSISFFFFFIINKVENIYLFNIYKYIYIYFSQISAPPHHPIYY